MKDFDKFVDYVVSNWQKEKKTILESAGLSGLSNRQYGDLAEEYILKEVNNLSPKYIGQITKGSQTPADIIAVSRRNGYWHIMLIQVKSSGKKESIYKLTDEEKKVFSKFAIFIKEKIASSGFLDTYKNKPIIISTGYTGVLRTETGNGIKHKLIASEVFNTYKKNVSNTSIDIENAKKKISIAHYLLKS